MNYFNFFSQYSGKRSSPIGDKKTLLTIGLAAVALCAGSYGFTLFRCASYQAQLDYLEKIKNDEGFLSQHSVATRVSEQIGGADQELAFMQLLEAYTGAVSTLDPELADLIDASTAGLATFSSITLSGLELELTGYAADLASVSAVERNFRGSERFSSVLRSLMERDTEANGMVYFTCLLQLKGEEAVGNE